MRILLVLAVAFSSVHADRVRIIVQGSSSSRAVALTFDAGADRGYAPRILEILERNHVRATFGLTGAWAAANASLLRVMVRDRDQILNHTFDHRSFTGLSTMSAPLSQTQRAWEIEHADAVIKRITRQTTKPYFRPPFGDYDGATVALLGRLGYRYMVMWTVDSLGWNHLPAASIVQRCLAHLVPGALILMHVGIQSQDALALQSLIVQVRKRGYRLETVSQLISHR